MQLAARGGVLGQALVAAANATACHSPLDSGTDWLSDSNVSIHASQGPHEDASGADSVHDDVAEASGAPQDALGHDSCTREGSGQLDSESDDDCGEERNHDATNLDSDNDSEESEADDAGPPGVDADPGDLDAIMDPSACLYGFLGAAEAVAEEDGVLDAIDEAAASLPLLQSTRAAVNSSRCTKLPSAGQEQMGHDEKKEWVDFGLQVLAQYDVEAEEWEAARAVPRWRRALAEPPSDDWDRKVASSLAMSMPSSGVTLGHMGDLCLPPVTDAYAPMDMHPA